MILGITVGRERHRRDTWEEISPLMLDVLKRLKAERRVGEWYDPGEDAWFNFYDQPAHYEKDTPDSCLRVAVNNSTGFGALIWCVTKGSVRKGGVYDSVWVSNNPAPPSFDPRVVADPGYPLFHDPHSTLPLTRVHAAVEEFCRSSTGERPDCINWTVGQLDGQRLDREYREREVDHTASEDPWA